MFKLTKIFSVKSIRSVAFLAGVMIFGLVMMSSTNALAEGSQNTCNGINTYFKWNCGGSNESGTGTTLGEVALQFLNWFSAAVLAMAVIGFIYGGITISSSGGDTSAQKKGINIIRNGFIALVLYFGMFAILNYLIPGGLFT